MGYLLAALAGGLTLPPRPCQAITVSEVMYHPAGDNPGANQYGEEFIELFNEASSSVDLSGYRFTRGISGPSGEPDFTLPAGTLLPSGEYLVVAREPAAMLARGVSRVVGPYGGHLQNSGERVTLVDPGGAVVLDFTFSDRGDWPAAGDGTGHSIVLEAPDQDPDRGRNWRHSLLLGGSPGGADTAQTEILNLVWAPDSRTQGCPTECSRYRYFKGTREPPADWNTPGFIENSEWLTGCGGWGYGDNDDCTQLTDMQQTQTQPGYMSVYARVTFDLTAQQIAWMTALNLEVRYDDGFVAYLNGYTNDPVDRARMTGTPPAFNKAADSPAIEPTTQAKDLTSRIGRLQPGRNVLALQGHNQVLNSSDFSLIPRLTAVIEPPAGQDDPARQIVINEIFADGSGTEWVELYNPTGQDIPLGGVWLSNDEDYLALEALGPLARVPAGGFLLLQKGIDFHFSLGTAGTGGQIFLTAPSQNYVLAGYEYGPQTPGHSIGRFPDGKPDWHLMDAPTPLSPNVRRRLSSVVINEIMYHAPQGPAADYVELHNTGAAPVTISSWEFAGVGFRFGSNVVLPPGGYAVVCDDRTQAAAAYGLDVNQLFGNFQGNLSNGGEKIVLLDENDLVVDWVDYSDRPPWPVTPDGLGASLERRCVSPEFDRPSDWIGSWVGGPTPGAANRVTDCAIPPAAPVVINEIMQHPCADYQDDARTEFVEIYNASDQAVDLTGWRLGGDIDYAYPDGRVLPGQAYLVASSDTAAGRASPGGLYSVYGSLSEANTVGPYAPELPNGGADVWLIGEDGRIVDAVHYSDDFPWPSAADACPEDAAGYYPGVQGRGRSLQRRCATAASDALANWEASPQDQATPGAVNNNVTCALPPTVENLAVTPSPVTSAVAPTIAATIAPYEGVIAAQLQYFVDDPQTTGEQLFVVAMTAAGNGVWTATLPARPANSIVRYRILLNSGSGLAVVSPRPAGDVYPWHAYFVDPQIASPVPVYHLFISAANWQLLYDYSSPGRVIGSQINPRWDDEVPAVFVAGGRVYDVTVRFQGSRWNRMNGSTTSFTCPSYSGNNQVQVLSWRIRFPSYRNFDGLDVLILQKQTGWPQRVSFRMFELAGVPAPMTAWARLQINGCTYNSFAYQIERPGADMVQRWFGEVGDLFKSQGYTGDEGPWSWGDERLITGSLNGYTEEQRYEYTYDRDTLTWKNRPGDGQSDLVEPLIEGLHAARAQGREALRDYLAQHFDVDLTLRYIATINYVGTFDDMFQNHFLYRKASDGKWCVTPWDMDNTLGGPYGEYNAHWLRGANRGDVGNRGGWWNRLKDSFFLAYEPEYVSMLLYLNNEVYPPEVMNPIVDAIAAERGQDPSAVKAHIQARHDWLNANVVLPLCSAAEPVVQGTLGTFTVEGPDEALVYRTTVYAVQASLAGSSQPISVRDCVQWTTSRPDIAAISDGQVIVRTPNPPPTLDIIATLTDASGPRTAMKTVRLALPGDVNIPLGPLAGGGDGMNPSLAVFAGINMNTGQFEPDHYNGSVGSGTTQPQPVPAPPGAGYDLIDSVFILHGDVAINRAGVRWGTANWINPTNPFNNGSWDFILNNAEPGAARPIRLRENGLVVQYAGGLGIHASAGVTFDLVAIAAYSSTELLRFQSRFGAHADPGAGSVEGFALFSDDQGVLAAQRSGVKRPTDNAYVFDMPVPAGAKYLTLASGDGGDGIGNDHAVFGDPVLVTRAYLPNPFDFDGDRDVDLDDLAAFTACWSGPGIPRPPACDSRDSDGDGDVDHADFGAFQRNFTGAR
ncbi:MAG: lamin tail domain-containing protein [Phycisphaerae bacterium]|jgi:hypothetical protein